MKLSSYKITERNEVFKHPIIAYALASGGFIAGGFGRKYLKDPEGIQRYLSVLYSGDSPGDVDIFFPLKSVYENVVEFAKLYQSQYNNSSRNAFTLNHWVEMRESPTKFCTNVWVTQESIFRNHIGSLNSPIKIQLVNVFHGDPEDVLETFDLENCRVAITSDSVIYSDEIVKLEELKTLKVVKPNSPLLPHRIEKYTSRRGMTNVHTSSASHMREWLLNWRLNIRTDHPFSHLSGNSDWGKAHLARLLKYDNLITTDQLSLLFGRLNYKERIRNGYSVYWKEVDPVRDEMKKRLR